MIDPHYLRVLREPRRARAVGNDVDRPHPRSVCVDGPHRVPELVAVHEAVEALGVVVLLLRKCAGLLAVELLPTGIVVVHPRVDDVDGELHVVRQRAVVESRGALQLSAPEEPELLHRVVRDPPGHRVRRRTDDLLLLRLPDLDPEVEPRARLGPHEAHRERFERREEVVELEELDRAHVDHALLRRDLDRDAVGATRLVEVLGEVVEVLAEQTEHGPMAVREVQHGHGAGDVAQERLAQLRGVAIALAIEADQGLLPAQRSILDEEVTAVRLRVQEEAPGITYQLGQLAHRRVRQKAPEFGDARTIRQARIRTRVARRRATSLGRRRRGGTELHCRVRTARARRAPCPSWGNSGTRPSGSSRTRGTPWCAPSAASSARGSRQASS
ncbi:MAG: hypothetical protein M5U28_25345 [Sandaracinaceae bacterium]|nr:hypothetical protein [Sandaracinaceae bacterium]